MPKSFAPAVFEITQAQSRFVGFAFAVALPCVIVIAGVVIWLRRRYR